MSEPFLGQIQMFGFNFAPRGWAFCDGQLLPINQNQSLFAVLGTTYGGDGRTTFALPDLRGRAPTHVGSGRPLGRRSGEEGHTLSGLEMPQHQHAVLANSDDGDTLLPSGNVLARTLAEIYHGPTNLNGTQSSTISPVGNGQAHDNMQPFLAISFAIALQGVFPSRN